MNYALAAAIGTRIRELRLQHGWSQAELGRRVGVNKSVISFYELGTRFPTYENLLRICDVFNISADFYTAWRFYTETEYQRFTLGPDTCA